MAGNNGITDGAAKDGSLLTSSKFIAGSPAEGLTPDEELAIVSDGYKLIGFYKDAKLTQRWFPSLESTSTNQVVFVKFMKTPIATVNYVAVSDEIVSDEMGSVSLESESFDVDDEEPAGSITTPKKGYVFTGWYSDEACTEKVSSDVEYKPTDLLRAEKTYTYYAKFEPEPEKSEFTVDELDNVIFNGEVQKQSPVIRASNPNYKDVTIKYTLMVGKRHVNITSAGDTKTYDGRTHQREKQQTRQRKKRQRNRPQQLCLQPRREAKMPTLLKARSLRRPVTAARQSGLS